MTGPKAASIAAVASFSIYLIPMLTRHGIWLLGEVMLQRHPSAPAWGIINVTVALVLQLAAALYLFWCLRKPGWIRALIPVLVLPALIVFLQRVYFVTIPLKFLEEPDLAPEIADWPVDCSVTGYYPVGLRSPTELGVRRSDQSNAYAILTMPGCRVRKAEPPPEPPLVLSTDEKWVGSLEVIPGTGPPVLHRVRIRPVTAKEPEKVIDLSPLGPESWVLMKLDMGAEELLLWRDRSPITVDFTAHLQKQYPRPQVSALSNTYTVTEHGWVAWDAYRDDTPYYVEWVLDGGSGTNRVPLGRQIHSVAVDPDGTRIAISVGTGLNIGSARDSVYVLNAGDATELFRKYLPTYSRSPVAFLRGGYFVYSDLAGIHVLRVPALK